MADPFIGEIRLFGFNFAPRGWAFCNGQLLAIQTNSALFSLLGTTYGGNGQTTFGLPNLQSRVPIHQGQGPGLSFRNMGDTGGNETHTLTINEMPAHNHVLNATGGSGSVLSPSGAYLAAAGPSDVPRYAAEVDVQMAAQTVGLTGNGVAHDIMPPYQVVNYCIALEGLYPSRN